MTTRILVVDDEPGIRAVLREYLGADGHEVMEAGTGGEALRLFEQTPADLVLLDVGLPDIDGLEVLRLLRQRSEVHVILVTARVEEVDKLVGLQMGADDYITKPFSPREVAARVKTVMRRSLRQAQGSYGVSPGPYGASQGAFGAPAAQPGPRIDPERREVIHRGAAVELSALEFDLLAAMAASPGRVWSRRQVLEAVWGGDFFGDERVVDVHIRNLRKALGDDATHPEVIGTVRGVGYKYLPGS
ncbi:MAG: response regulator transcription factor [Luteococcus sp.]|uniref:response regulator transcription factor n=1 Tax=Luteococcus sp. TaxID=1969402 RepID=UPI0026474EC4|nr:response regulator transcription factor [Luteococcus sp.]MDN5564981.1 response regulator transcription factor [Luteococcus sp.]